MMLTLNQTGSFLALEMITVRTKCIQLGLHEASREVNRARILQIVQSCTQCWHTGVCANSSKHNVLQRR